MLILSCHCFNFRCMVLLMIVLMCHHHLSIMCFGVRLTVDTAKANEQHLRSPFSSFSTKLTLVEEKKKNYQDMPSPQVSNSKCQKSCDIHSFLSLQRQPLLFDPLSSMPSHFFGLFHTWTPDNTRKISSRQYLEWPLSHMELTSGNGLCTMCLYMIEIVQVSGKEYRK